VAFQAAATGGQWWFYNPCLLPFAFLQGKNKGFLALS